jgi:hypothetical protein
VPWSDALFDYQKLEGMPGMLQLMFYLRNVVLASDHLVSRLAYHIGERVELWPPALRSIASIVHLTKLGRCRKAFIASAQTHETCGGL